MGKVSPLRRTAGVLLALAFFAGCGDGEGSWPRFIDSDAGLTDVCFCSLAWGDYDGDGDLDLVLAGDTEDTGGTYVSKIYENEGGVFTDVGANLPGVRGYSVVWGDYDSDGDLDLALQGYDGETAINTVYRNDGGVFDDTGAALTEVVCGALAWGDYDNDGDLDLAQVGSGPVAKVYQNDGGTFVDTGAALTGVIYSWLAWGDYDNDGDLDLALAGYTGSTEVSKIYSNDGGTFTDIGAGLTGVQRCSLAWGDYDNDGDLDLALAGQGTWDVSLVYRNDVGTFTDVGAVLPPTGDCSLAWGDCDNDGDLDLALAGWRWDNEEQEEYHASNIHRNDGGGAFVDIGAGLVGVSTGCSVVWGDYDGDGDLDLALAGGGDGAAEPWLVLPVSRIYRNSGVSFNAAPSAPSALSADVFGTDVVLGWSVATDAETPVPGLSYNLRVRPESGTEDVVPGMADEVTGYRRIPALGNAQKRCYWILRGLTSGTYYWSVQAIDTAYAGSPWAPEETVVVP